MKGFYAGRPFLCQSPKQNNPDKVETSPLYIIPQYASPYNRYRNLKTSSKIARLSGHTHILPAEYRKNLPEEPKNNYLLFLTFFQLEETHRNNINLHPKGFLPPVFRIVMHFRVQPSQVGFE